MKLALLGLRSGCLLFGLGLYPLLIGDPSLTILAKAFAGVILAFGFAETADEWRKVMQSRGTDPR